MATTSEIGISPALLQAITQTLSTNRSVHESSEARENAGAERIVIAGDKPIIKVDGTAQPHILHGMNEPVSNIAQLGSGETVIVLQNMEGGESGGMESVQGASQHVIIKNMPPSSIQNVVLANSDKDGGAQNVNMGSVLSAIATQLRNEQGSTGADDSSQEAHLDDPNQPIYISVSGNNSVPSPIHDVTVTEMPENMVSETVVQTTQHFERVDTKQLRIIEPNVQTQNGASIILNPQTVQERAVLEAVKGDGGETHYVYRTVRVDQPDTNPPQNFDGSEACPICGDKISGYHYGIYTCESCKGFFKRTVQNKKTFICHRKGDCVITVQNRKKCPACRFRRCVIGGMKLEAIREDRTRGGRSSYDGCSPHGRPNKPPRKENTPRNLTYARPTSASGSKPGSNSHDVNLVKVNRPAPKDIVPHTPQILDDLMAVESLLAEDDEEQQCCEGKFVDDDPNLFASLLHLADHCLYKIVRWARNLPDFPSVTTDDQILLLQNCWAELLCLTSCWNSISGDNVIRLSHGRCLTMEKAASMGLKEVTQRMLDITASFRSLAIDQHEMVALKVLLLLSPDVKNLKDKEVIRQYQDKLLEALRVYSTTHTPTKPSKFIELLAKLPELSRTCIITKELLTQRQAAGEVPQYSLLSELLKGDVAVQ